MWKDYIFVSQTCPLKIYIKSIFFQVILPEENPQILPLILRLVPNVNPRICRAQGGSKIGLESITTIYPLRAQLVT
jgi:hypothetical protein